MNYAIKEVSFAEFKKTYEQIPFESRKLVVNDHNTLYSRASIYNKGQLIGIQISRLGQFYFYLDATVIH